MTILRIQTQIAQIRTRMLPNRLVHGQVMLARAAALHRAKIFEVRNRGADKQREHCRCKDFDAHAEVPCADFPDDFGDSFSQSR